MKNSNVWRSNLQTLIFGSSASKFLFLPLLEMLKKFEGVRRKLGLPRMLLPSWRSTPTEILPNAELGREEFYLPILCLAGFGLKPKPEILETSHFLWRNQFRLNGMPHEKCDNSVHSPLLSGNEGRLSHP